MYVLVSWSVFVHVSAPPLDVGAHTEQYLVFADSPSDVTWCKQHIPPRLRFRFFSEFVPLVGTWDKGAMVKGHGWYCYHTW